MGVAVVEVGGAAEELGVNGGQAGAVSLIHHVSSITILAGLTKILLFLLIRIKRTGKFRIVDFTHGLLITVQYFSGKRIAGSFGNSCCKRLVCNNFGGN